MTDSTNFAVRTLSEVGFGADGDHVADHRGRAMAHWVSRTALPGGRGIWTRGESAESGPVLPAKIRQIVTSARSPMPRGSGVR